MKDEDLEGKIFLELNLDTNKEQNFYQKLLSSTPQQLEEEIIQAPFNFNNELIKASILKEIQDNPLFIEFFHLDSSQDSETEEENKSISVSEPNENKEDKTKENIPKTNDSKINKSIGEKILKKIKYFYFTKKRFFKKKGIKLLKLKRKKGRKKKDEDKKDDSSKTKVHTKYSTHNINIKIKIYCDNCIVEYLNECLKLSKKYNGQKFYKFSHKSKIRSINNTIESLKYKKLKDIIVSKNSNKYLKKKENTEDNINDKIYQEFKDDEILKNIFSEDYYHFFKNIFYKRNREIKIKINNNEYKTINLSKKVTLFFDLLEKNNSKDRLYQDKLKINAFKYFMPNSIFIVH